MSQPTMTPEPPLVEIAAPCRLHFGLFSFGQTTGRRFGGAGVMLASPALRLRAGPAETFAAEGPLAWRVAEFARRWAESRGLSRLPACRLSVVEAPPAHSGLGVGTQLGLSAAAALNCWTGQPCDDVEELARQTGRGKRSAVGAHGFQQGGLLVELGKSPGQRLGKLLTRVAPPKAWRFVLVRPTDGEGLSGRAEQTAFAQLPPPPRSTTEAMLTLARDQLAPAAEQGDFDRFATALEQYGELAGSCFAPLYADRRIYASPRTAKLASRMKDLGARGVGQSSWGPTLFAVCLSPQRAGELRDRLLQTAPAETGPLHVHIAAVSPGGAEIKTLSAVTENDAR